MRDLEFCFYELAKKRSKPYYEANDTIYQSKTGERVRIMSILADSRIDDGNNRWDDLITTSANLTCSRRWFYENNWEIYKCGI